MQKRKFKASGLREGDRVIMHTCGESRLEKYKDKTFTCTSEPWDLCGSEVIMLDGVRGGFATEYLRKVK
jgi:hypothetical protein